MSRIITIGRDRNSDIRIDERYDTVSNNHADIEQQGNDLVFYDHSSNGTVINGQKVHNMHVRIYPNDRILLANAYELEWNTLNRFFPNLHRPTVIKNAAGGQEGYRKTVPLSMPTEPMGAQRKGRSTEPFQANVQNPAYHSSIRNQPPRNDNFGQANTYSQAEIDAAIRRWNWGAFFCSWIWAAFHKTYWPMFILIVGLIPYLGQVCSLALNVYLGVSGSKIAWECGKYADFESYKNAQRNWAIIGIILFIVGVAASSFLVYTTLSLI